MQIAYPHIAERLFGRALAIDPVALRAIMEGPLARRILSGEEVSKKEAKKGRSHRHARLTALAGDVQRVRKADGLIDYAITPDGIAIIPISGVLSRRFDWLAAACGFSTYESIAATLSAAVNDLGVQAILFDIDTPGGEAAGMLDAADAILAARGQKPIWAVANTLAASAGYALAGSATKLFLPRLAQVGSIGCVLVHVDQSVRDAASGLNYTAIYSGARKIDGWGHAPLSDAAQKVAQADVDHVRDVFADLVRRQGRVSGKAALATEAAVYADDEAVEVGLADGVMTFDEALAELTSQLQESSMSKADLKSSASAGTIAVAEEASRRAAGAAASAVAADAAAATPAAEIPGAEAQAGAKKKSDDMTPPAPGEKCELCGQTMPDDDDNDAGDEDGDNEEQQTGKGKKSKPAGHTHAAPAAAAPGYSVIHARKTVELCTIAKAPQLAAAFIENETPLKKVRAALMRRASEEGGDEISAARPPSGDSEKNVAAAWDKVVAEINEKMAPKSAR